ncbi:multicopper oxidase family protein [Sphaerisporangium corydalis]|uniref:Copper-containing nitrite reductase n=1 Tax=Sphaerisporangium corydalis TaxID=1441875 RepID=A0ABV9EHF0_9ACTN|nr:multicopper oxidase family protein [Sphaerisporangium corydalis]
MTVASLTALDLLAGVVAALAWLGAGATAATRRARVAAALFAVALVASLARVGLTVALGFSGWWFVQEKITLTVPLLVVAALAATVLAAPRLLTTDALTKPVVVVPLFGAGFSAAAGPVVTLLVGYPATLSTGLLTLALVGVAVLVTWRVVASPAPRLRAAAAATLAAGLLGAGLAFVPAPATDTGGGPPDAGSPMSMARTHPGAMGPAGMRAVDTSDRPGRPVTDLRGPVTPAPGGTVRRYTLTARTATITLSSGRRVEAWTFDGRVPGPPVTAAEGDLVEVRLRNSDIAAGVTLHWHGYDVASGEDGVPGLTQEAVLPGREFVYRFRATQVGTYWYHTHEVSDRGVKMGLYGTLIVTPRTAADGSAADPDHVPPTTDLASPTTEPTATTEPPATGNVPPGADLVLPVHTFAGVTALGDQDRPFERRVPPGAPVRLRLINTDDTPHQFALAGTTYRLAAIDGRDLHGPGELGRTRLRLPAGGRYDLVFPMPRRPAALIVDGRAASLHLVPDATGTSPTTATDAPVPEGTPVTDSSPVAPSETAGWPEFDPLSYGTPAATPFDAGSRFDRRFTLVLDRGLTFTGGRPLYAQTVNGRAFPSIPTQMVREGDLVRFTVVNRGGDTHPWHLHGHTILVLSRDGRRPAGSPLWLDTFDVRPGEVWEVAFRAGNPGMWMNHCHNLAHADLGMALHLAYEGVTTPFHGAHGG